MGLFFKDVEIENHPLAFGQGANGIENFRFGELVGLRGLVVARLVHNGMRSVVNGQKLRLPAQIVQRVVQVEPHQPSLETAEVAVAPRFLDGFENRVVRKVFRHRAVAHITEVDANHLGDVLVICLFPKAL